MSHANPDRETLDTAKDLTDALNGMRAELRRLSHRGIINRVLIIIVALVAALAVFNAYRVSGVANQAAAASSSAHQNQVSNISACRASNVTRHKEIGLWNHLAAISRPAPGTTPKQEAKNKAAIAAFLAYVARTFAPRNCQQIYKIGGR